jgi:phosphoenolpyruvate carboxykinase (ATP)
MKDPTLPPVLKLNDSVVASVMGATLATKRTTAERLAEGVDPNALVVEPYANPSAPTPWATIIRPSRSSLRKTRLSATS